MFSVYIYACRIIDCASQSAFFNIKVSIFEIPHMFTFSQENSSKMKCVARTTYRLDIYEFTFDTNSSKSFEVKCLMIGRDLDKLQHTMRYLRYLQCTQIIVSLLVIMSMQFYLECYIVCVFFLRKMYFLDIFGVCYVALLFRLKIHTHAHSILLFYIMSHKWIKEQCRKLLLATYQEFLSFLFFFNENVMWQFQCFCFRLMNVSKCFKLIKSNAYYTFYNV